MTAQHIHHIIIDGVTSETAPMTIGSAVSQAASPTLEIAVSVILDHEAPVPPAVHGENIRILTLDAQASPASRANHAAGALPQASSLRFLTGGDVLMPRASLDDVAALASHPWCTSVAADSDGTTIAARPPGVLETGTILDEWAAESVSLTVHPATAAYDFAFFAALGGFSGIEYAHQAELLARANDASCGTFRAGAPSMTLGPAIETLHRRPSGFRQTRRAVADLLLAGRAARIHSRRTITGPRLWDEVSNAAWETHNEGYAEVAGPNDDLWDVLTQARKYHYRFAWSALVTYAESAVDRFDDDYLAAMLLTGRAAQSGTDSSWHGAIEHIDRMLVPRLAHLFMTAVFETGTTTPWVLTTAIRYADAILDVNPDDPVAHYRMVSFHRLLEDWPTAERWRRRTLDQLARVRDPNLQNHLRERIIVETTAILPRLREHEAIDALS